MKRLPPHQRHVSRSWTLLGIGAICVASSAHTERPAGMASATAAIRAAICRQHTRAQTADRFTLQTYDAPHSVNESGVLFVVNCTGRRIIRVRDPGKAPSHLNPYPYDAEVRDYPKAENQDYEILNFNARAHNSSIDHTAYSRSHAWTGRCLYRGLQLTTEAPGHSDRQTVTFDLNVCKQQIVALLSLQ